MGRKRFEREYGVTEDDLLEQTQKLIGELHENTRTYLDC
jgi:hypothetical protein